MVIRIGSLYFMSYRIGLYIEVEATWKIEG